MFDALLGGPTRVLLLNFAQTRLRGTEVWSPYYDEWCPGTIQRVMEGVHIELYFHKDGGIETVPWQARQQWLILC